jgi:hypothetical protein
MPAIKFWHSSFVDIAEEIIKKKYGNCVAPYFLKRKMNRQTADVSMPFISQKLLRARRLSGINVNRCQSEASGEMNEIPLRTRQHL